MAEVGKSVVHSIIKPMSFLMWISELVIHPSILWNFNIVIEDLIEYPPPVDPDNIIAGSFLNTFPPDGYVPATTHYATAEGGEVILQKTHPQHLSWRLIGSVLFGLPNRPPGKIKNIDDCVNLSQNVGGRQNFRQIVRNFFGGWDSLEEEPGGYSYTVEGKRFWNLLVLPVKFFIIFPVKLIGVPLKIILNIVKLFSEFLSEIILNFTGKIIGYLAVLLIENRRAASRGHKTWRDFIFFVVMSLLLFPILFPLHYAARMVSLISQAMFSPEKSARNAWEYGKRLRPKAIGFIFGAVGAAMSVILSTVLWMFALPFLVSGILQLLPQLVPLLNALAQWPVVVSGLKLMQGVYLYGMATLPAVFSTALTALSAFLGVTTSTTVLIVTFTVALYTPIIILLSRAADIFSDAWARWEAHMNFASGIKAMFRISSPSQEEGEKKSSKIELDSANNDDLDDSDPNHSDSDQAPSPAAKRLVGAEQGSMAKATNSSPTYVAQKPAVRAPANASFNTLPLGSTPGYVIGSGDLGSGIIIGASQQVEVGAQGFPSGPISGLTIGGAPSSLESDHPLSLNQTPWGGFYHQYPARPGIEGCGSHGENPVELYQELAQQSNELVIHLAMEASMHSLHSLSHLPHFH